MLSQAGLSEILPRSSLGWGADSLGKMLAEQEWGLELWNPHKKPGVVAHFALCNSIMGRGHRCVEPQDH